MELKKTLVLVMLFAGGIGCASVSSRPYACEKSSEKLNFYYWPNKIFGNTLQIGDCAVSDTLRIETGQYYGLNKDDIDWAVSTDKGVGYGGASELDGFAKAMNCNKESYLRFNEMLLKKKTEIFGEKFDNSSRTVTLNVVREIKADPGLVKSCGG